MSILTKFWLYFKHPAFVFGWHHAEMGKSLSDNPFHKMTNLTSVKNEEKFEKGYLAYHKYKILKKTQKVLTSGPGVL